MPRREIFLLTVKGERARPGLTAALTVTFPTALPLARTLCLESTVTRRGSTCSQYPGIACARHKHGVVDALVHCTALHGRWRAVSLLYLKLKSPSLCFLS